MAMPSDTANRPQSDELRRFLNGRRERDHFECRRAIEAEIRNVATVLAPNRKNSVDVEDREEMLYNLAYKRAIERHGWFSPEKRIKYPVLRINVSKTINVRYDLKEGMAKLVGSDLWLKDDLLFMELIGLLFEYKSDPVNFSVKVDGEIHECNSKTYSNK